MVLSLFRHATNTTPRQPPPSPRLGCDLVVYSPIHDGLKGTVVAWVGQVSVNPWSAFIDGDGTRVHSYPFFGRGFDDWLE